MLDPLGHPHLEALLGRQPYGLVMATISGAHLYGFPSVDSDIDVRGIHLLPVEEVVGLRTGPETIESMEEPSDTNGQLELDVVTHDLRKFCTLLLRRNGYVLEQLLSPLVLRTSAVHEELVALAPGCITRHHAHHYLGFASTQWKLFEKERPRRLKPLLYEYRVLLTGIHLMRTGVIEANLAVLNEDARITYLDELIAQKRGAEQGTIPDADMPRYEADCARLRGELEAERDRTHLPDAPSVRDALHDLVVRARLT